MNNSVSTLIIPVESQVRELDAKILLSCVAAENGFRVIMGSRAFIHFQIADMPRGVYVAKSMRSLSASMFSILRKLGHEIVAWEEEALVHPPADTYFTLRLSPKTVKNVAHVFAWGQENSDLMRQYPELPSELPIHVTGNPRGDMLRAEMRPYFAAEVEKLRQRYGNFILINTNFSDVNPFIPAIGLFVPTADDPQKAGTKRGQAGVGMSRQFAEGLWRHKQAILESFKQLIPALEQVFPNLTIVIRPHPSENLRVYNEIAANSNHVHVTNEGNVIPWLIAAKCMIHNGCTTGLEAYALGLPTISYLATLNEYYDYEFQGLPNKLSHQCFNFEQLKETLTQVLNGTLGTTNEHERQKLLNYHLAAQDGSLACERIVNILQEYDYHKRQPTASPTGTYIQGWLYAKVKAALTQLYMHRPGPNRLAYHNHRFPEIAATDIEQKITRFSCILKRFNHVRVQQYSKHLFSIVNEQREDTNDQR